VQNVKDLDAAELSLQSITDTLPHHVLYAGAVKQATLYSGFIQHQSSSLLFFRRYRFKTMFYCDLQTELGAVCLYGLYQELDALLLYYYYILLVTYFTDFNLKTG